MIGQGCRRLKFEEAQAGFCRLVCRSCRPMATESVNVCGFYFFFGGGEGNGVCVCVVFVLVFLCVIHAVYRVVDECLSVGPAEDIFTEVILNEFVYWLMSTTSLPWVVI